MKPREYLRSFGGVAAVFSGGIRVFPKAGIKRGWDLLRAEWNPPYCLPLGETGY